MTRTGRFEKVTLPQFMADVKKIYGFKYTDEEIEKAWDDLKLPRRATSGSAGYDFYAPFPFTLAPGGTVTIPTGIRVKINPGWWLGCFPRSGLGFKYRLQLDNTIGVIDSDFSQSDNEGHIFIKLTYDKPDGNPPLSIQRGGAYMQAIFIPHGITYDDDATETRNGGFGSTDKK